MAVTIRVAKVSYGDDQHGKPWAIVTFHVSAQEDGGRVAEDFTLDIGVPDHDDPTTTVNAARSALRLLALDMAEATST